MTTIETVGIHPSTELCMEALQWLHEADYEFTNALDMGCGSGILSIAAASVWEAKVLAADISEKALEDAKSTIAGQQLEGRITLVRSDGFSNPLIKQRAPYDLMFLNILAKSVVEMAQDVKGHIAPGGIVILGGILAWLATETELSYQGLGFEIIKKYVNSPWHVYVLKAV